MATINSITPELTADWDLQLGSDGSLKMLSGTAGIAQNVGLCLPLLSPRVLFLSGLRHRLVQ